MLVTTYCEIDWVCFFFKLVLACKSEYFETLLWHLNLTWEKISQVALSTERLMLALKPYTTLPTAITSHIPVTTGPLREGSVLS